METIQLPQSRIDQIQWYHDLDFPNGLKARTTNPDAEFHRKLWAWMRSELDKIDFAGKTVLDIGCWDGYWSFYAEQRGASRVLASDDKTQNWSANSGLELAKELMGSAVETRTDVSIYEAAKLGERFDIVLCMGVYYHLVDPFYAFSQVRHCCNKQSVVVFEGDFAPEGSVQPQRAAYVNETSFVPSEPFLRHMLEANYFCVMKESMCLGVPAPIDRILVVCEPFEGENALHRYRPPFGLHAYDPRFSADRFGSSPITGRRADYRGANATELQKPLAGNPSFLGIEIGSAVVPGVSTKGLHREENAGGTRLRWTDGDAKILVPVPSNELARKVAIVLYALTNTKMSLLLDDTEVMTLDVAPGLVSQTLPLNPPVSGRVLSIGVKSATFVPGPQDTRTLGVQIRSVRLLP